MQGLVLSRVNPHSTPFDGLLEGITAPLYLHPLFFGRTADAGHARELVRRLLIYVEADQGSP